MVAPGEIPHLAEQSGNPARQKRCFNKTTERNTTAACQQL